MSKNRSQRDTQGETSMDKCINFYEFMSKLFDDEKQARQGAAIVKGLLEAQSPRLTHISEKMDGKGASNYKAIQRFLKKVDLQRVLVRLYQEGADFVIGDPTEMERYKAPKTAYVGTLSDGKTAGYWLMVLSTPFRGRSLPFSFVVYSSKTLGTQVTSRNQEHFRCFEAVKGLLGDRPLVLDREFSYQELMEILYIEKIQFVIRLNLGDQHKQPRLIDADGEPVKLVIKPGETVMHSNVYYLGTVKVNLIGYWRKGLSKPLWVMTTLEPKRGLEIYLQRMKIEIVCTQMTKTHVFTAGTGRDNVTNFNFFIIHNDSIYQQFYQLPALFEVQFIQCWLNPVAKFLDMVGQCKRFNLLLGLIFQLFQLLLETILGLRQFLTFSFKFVSRDNLRQIHFQKAFLLAFQARQSLASRVAFCLQSLGQPIPGLGTFQLVGNQIWVGYDATEILPDQLIKLMCWGIASCAPFTFRSPMYITPPSAGVIGIPALGTARRRQMALTTTDQATKQIIMGLIVSTCHVLVLLQVRLSHIKYISGDNGWNRNFNPFLWQGRLHAFSSPYGLQGRFTLPCWNWPSAAAIGNADIGRGPQHISHRGWIPTFHAMGCRDFLFVQFCDNPMDRPGGFRVSIPGENLADNFGLDRVNPYPTGIPGPLGVQDIPIRGSCPWQEPSGSKFCLTSTPHSIGNQVALIFCYRSTNLKQELIMGIVSLHRALQKLDFAAQLFQLLNQQNLVHVFTCQSIRSGNQDQFKSGHVGSVSHSIQVWTIEFGPRVTIITINMLRGKFPIWMLGDCLSQSFNLLLNALTLHLSVGRYSSVQSNLHDHSPDWVVVLLFVPSSSVEGTDRRNPNAFANQGTLQLCDRLAIVFSCFLLNGFSHLGEAYLKSSFPQSQRATPPSQFQLTPSYQAEFVICDQTIEETFRDCKDLLHLTKLMNKKQTLLEQMIALCLLAYVVGVWLGEALRDVAFGNLDISLLPEALLTHPTVDVNAHPKWLIYSGLFVLLKQKLRLSRTQVDRVTNTAASAFAVLVCGNVPSVLKIVHAAIEVSTSRLTL
jgi:hypothetical protein